MIEKIINDVIARLDGKISSDDIIKVKNILSITLNDYEFTKMCEKPTPLGVGWIAQR